MGRPQEAAQDVLSERVLCVILNVVPLNRIEHTPTAGKLVDPRDGALIARELCEDRNSGQAVQRARLLVPFLAVRSYPRRRKTADRRMVDVLQDDGARRAVVVVVAAPERAHEVLVPRPSSVALAVGRRVHAGIASAVLHVL